MSEVKEVRKVPILLELIGEPSSGKTHLSCLYPKPALLDTTPKGEGYTILKKLYPTEWKKRYFRVRVFDDFKKDVKLIKVDANFFRTVIVDTSVDLRTLGGKAHLKDLQGKKPDRQSLMPEEWGPVNVMIDEFITEINDPEKMGLNLVLTSQMKDEWVARKSTGRRIRKGLQTMNFQADIRLFLQLKQKVNDKMQYIPNEYERIGRVVKCRFRDQTDKEDWIPELKSKEVNEKGEVVQEDMLNWEGIKKLAKLEAGEVVE